MKRPLGDRLAVALFGASIIVLTTMYGVFAGRFDWFPSPQISLAEATVRDLGKHWKNDLGLQPDRHLVLARRPATDSSDTGYRMYAPDKIAPGFVLIAGLNPDQTTSVHAVTLYDAAGRQLHRWPVRYGELDPEGPGPENVMLHGMAVFEDGSIAVTFDAGGAMARLDPCGNPMWVTRREYHHSIERDGKGNLWSWRYEDIERIDENTGEYLDTLTLRDQILSAGDGQEGIFAIRASSPDEEDRRGLKFEVDAFHTNDVEPLTAELADAFPMFREGDLLISLRELNLVAVIEPEEGRLRWYRHGPWHRQHDPDFQPDGTITVLDNRMGLGRSRILRVDPASNEVSEVYPTPSENEFYTWRRGKHQILPNGNILVTEAEGGRVFEVAPDGSLVWEREMRWDSDQNVIVTEAQHVPPGFFRDGPPHCEEEVVSLGP